MNPEPLLSPRRFKHLMRRALRALGRATGTAHQIALGVAIGFFVAWLPIIGLQMVVAVIVCQLLGANKIVPIFPIWITNPATMVPIYSFNYWIGWLVVGGPPLSDLAAILRTMITPPKATEEMGRFDAWWDGVKHAFSELLSMGWDMQLPLWLGCSIVGLALAIPSYYISYRFVESFRRAVAKKKQLRQDKRKRDAAMDVPVDGGYTRNKWPGGE
ncbi:MAG: DUF2062 domain-containing protein [Planctomycetota bacterium]|jgi:uncharacterized protein (DUF2062 family)|nr:DUF2062 domain-containing protein [Planctomycetota bacterium]